MEFIENLQKALTLFALIVGGCVAWMKFVGGRLDKVRLEPAVNCELHSDGEFDRLMVTMKIANKGLFAAPVPKCGFILELLAPKPDIESLDTQDSEWEAFSAFSAFCRHNTILTGETIQDVLRISVAKGRYPALQLRLRIDHKGRGWAFLPITLPATWEAKAIVHCTPSENQSP